MKNIFNVVRNGSKTLQSPKIFVREKVLVRFIIYLISIGRKHLLLWENDFFETFDNLEMSSIITKVMNSKNVEQNQVWSGNGIPENCWSFVWRFPFLFLKMFKMVWPRQNAWNLSSAIQAIEKLRIFYKTCTFIENGQIM